MYIESAVKDIAVQMGLLNLNVAHIRRAETAISGISQVLISARGHVADSFVYESDIEDIKRGIINDHLEIRIRDALSRLQPDHIS